MSPTILDNTAALASLHNFPTGNQYNPWVGLGTKLFPQALNFIQKIVFQNSII